jgi:ketosteroid isomerase-like protein
MSDVAAFATDIAANKKLVRDFFAAWTAGNFDQLGVMIEPDGEYWTVRSRSGIPLSEMIKRVRATYSETEEGLRFTVGLMTAEDDRVSVLLQGEADFPGREHYLQLYHALVNCGGGRVTRLAIYYDTALSNRVMRGEEGPGPLPSHAPGYQVS